MEYKYDNSDVRCVSYVILEDKDLKKLPIKNNTFNDGGKTRVMDYSGYLTKNGETYISAGYRDKRIQFLYTPKDFEKALIGMFLFVAN